MSDADAFIQEVRANPEDDTPRLIYADFLEEQGDPRGELIRVQVELGMIPVGAAERGPLLKREQFLLDEYSETWLQPLRSLGVDGVSRNCFHGGLLEKVRMTADRLIRNAAELCDLEPALHRIQLHEVSPVLPGLARLVLPEQVRELDFTACQLGADGVAMLTNAPWSRQVQSLVLSFNQLGDEGLVELLSGTWPRLVSLTLDANRITNSGTRALRRSALFSQLKRISLKANEIDPDLLPAASLK